MKKATVFCVAIMLALVMFSGASLAAAPYDGDVKPNAVMLLDATTGQVLYEKNADERIYPASTTKILSCIVALENGNLDDTVTVGEEGDWTGSGYSLMGIKKGQQLTLRELIYGMMLISGNDAAAAIAVHIGGSIEGFAAMMNQKAQELGMVSSNFITPHGVDTEGHYVTARDMATLTMYAMKNEQFMQIVGAPSYDFPSMPRLSEKAKKNTNKLLVSDVDEGETSYYYEYATGIKTGATPKAYRCLVSSAEKDGMKLLCLIFGDETKDGNVRWTLSQSLFEYGFNNYETMDIGQLVDSMPLSANVTGASPDDEQGGVLALSAVFANGAYATLDKTRAQTVRDGGLSAQVTLAGGDMLQAPVTAGDIVGTVTYTDSEGEPVATAQVAASRDVFVDTGDINVPAQETAEPQTVTTPEPQTVESGGIASWVWYAAGGALLGLLLVFAVGLIRANNRRKRRKRNYAQRKAAQPRSDRR